MTSPLVPVGWISYWNLLPLRYEIERHFGPEQIELHRGHPSTVNRWLAEGRVLVAPSSSICLLTQPHNEIAVPLGIAAFGPVLSVYLGLHQDDGDVLELIRSRNQALREGFRAGVARFGHDARKLTAQLWAVSDSLPPIPPDSLPPLQATPASAASNMFARILYRLWFGEAAYARNAAEGAHTSSRRRPIEIQIGDEALLKRSSYRTVVDLGEVWRELTNLPFVFAVWQTNGKRPLPKEIKHRLMEAAEIAQARMRVEPSSYMPDNTQGVDLAAYWKVIQYRLDATHFMGLALYLSMARRLSPALSCDQAVVSIMRWEQAAQNAAPGLFA